MDNSKRCALIRQTWYEAIKANMKPEAQLLFFQYCMEFEFYNKIPDRERCPFSEVLLMFDAVKYDLEADRQKADNIAERNRRNGVKGGRPPKGQESDNLQNPVGYDENPENPNGYFGPAYTYTNTNTNTKTNTSVFKSTHTNFDLLEKFNISLHFFAIGVRDAVKEMQLFYDYYTARGWNVAKDTPVNDKVALARAWRPKEIVPELINTRAQYVQLLKFIDAEELELITDFVIWRDVKDENERAVHLTLSGRTAHDILEDKYIVPMTKYFQTKLEGASLCYHIQPKLIE